MIEWIGISFKFALFTFIIVVSTDNLTSIISSLSLILITNQCCVESLFADLTDTLSPTRNVLKVGYLFVWIKFGWANEGRSPFGWTKEVRSISGDMKNL